MDRLVRIVLLVSIVFCVACSAKQKTTGIVLSLLKDPSKQISFDQVIASTDFVVVKDISTLNFGISKSADHWIRVAVAPDKSAHDYTLYISTIVPDTIIVYEQYGQEYKKSLIGEAFQTDKHFLSFSFSTDGKEKNVFMKITGDGQPLYFPVEIHENKQGSLMEYKTVILTGFLYGILFLIMLLSFLLYRSTKEKIYLYFFFLNLCSSSVIFYFDGYVKLFLIQDSIYWNNEFIAVAFCGSFIATNYYISTFLNLNIHQPKLLRYYTIMTVLFLVILSLSFWHPTGFQLYIVINIFVTSMEALLFFVSVLSVRKVEKEYFVLQLISIVLIIFFGTITQLFFLGYLPNNTLTLYSVHGMIFPQLILQSFALWKRMEMLARDRASYHELSEKYSQSLISNIENERKRLAGEFHDSIGQNLLVIRNRLLLMFKTESSPEHIDKLKYLAAITSDTLAEIREISQDLRPSVLDTLGLNSALVNMMERLKGSTTIELNYAFDPVIDSVQKKEFDINVFRIVQELMNNMLKHSKATTVTVTIKKTSSTIRITAEDNGIGFDVTTISVSSNGLSGIKHRVNILKGEYSFVSEKERGTLVAILIPLEE